MPTHNQYLNLIFVMCGTYFKDMFFFHRVKVNSYYDEVKLGTRLLKAFSLSLLLLFFMFSLNLLKKLH